MMVGFRAKVHHEQKRVARFERWVASSDDRALPPEDFTKLHGRFSFTVDAAAAAHNAKLPRFWSTEDDGLSIAWGGERVYCNPPFSDIRPWVEKAWREALAPLIVLLLPANRTEQAWWQDLIEPRRDRPGSPLRVEFLRKRIEFIRPTAGICHVPFGCCLCIWERPQ